MTVRLADDDRGRVPFALVGALLLVASATVATTVSRPDPDPGPPDAAVASDRALAEARTAIRSAVASALERGAAAPVVSPADTPYGRVLNDSAPYRDALRVRAYVRAERALAATTVDVGDATATVSLDPVDRPADLRDGKRDVALDGHGNATVTATVREVSLVVKRDGLVVARETHDVSVTVASPAFVLHDRVERYDRRLHRTAVDGPGFGRQFGARVYGMAWLRGYAQYGGAPVDNVVGTRHVALAANGAALASQRAVFGRADGAAARAHRRAVARVGIRDVTQQYSRPGVDSKKYLDAVLGSHPGGSFAHASPGVPAVASPSPGPGDGLEVSVDATADDAFADFLSGTDGPGIDDALDGAYDVRLDTAVRTQTLDRASDPDLEPDGRDWTHVETTSSREVSVENATAPAPAPGEAEATVGRAGRVVEVTRTYRARWSRPNESANGTATETTTTTDVTVERVRVGVAVHATHHPNRSVAAPVPSAFDERSRVDPNLVDLRGVGGEVLDAHGGADDVAVQAATGRVGRVDLPVLPASGNYTERTRAVVYRDVAALRDDVREVSVTVERGSVLTGAPATAELLSAVRDRRRSLAPVPGSYDSVAEVASVAAQRAYLRQVERRLAERVAQDSSVLSRARGAVRRTLTDATDRAVGGLADVQRAVQRTDASRAASVENRLVGGVDVAVAGSPSYLVVDGVDAERVRSVARRGKVHPLAARNVNVFTVPSSDATSNVVDAVTPKKDGVGLRQAVRQLQRASAVADGNRTDELSKKQRRLRESVASSVAATRERVASTLAERTTLDEDAATLAVEDAFSSYPSTRARAAAVVDGSIASRVVDAAADRAVDPPARFEDATRTHVSVALREARATSEVRPPDGAVKSLRKVLGQLSSGAAKRAVREGVGGALNRTNVSFLGLPLAPVPGYWYATANVWVVQVRATYPTFAVRARNATTGRLGATTYVRDGSAVAMDVDGDGVADRLGYADRVTARATVPVGVVVPPGKDGVGDRNYLMFENSPGWPCPVPDHRPGATNATVADDSRSDSSDRDDAGGVCGGDLYAEG